MKFNRTDKLLLGLGVLVLVGVGALAAFATLTGV